MSPAQRIRLMTAEIQRLRVTAQEHAKAAEKAREALPRLVHVCAQKTGQSYHVRELLYSLWNGQPGKLIELLSLDWAVRLDVLAVCAGFGFEPYEGPGGPHDADTPSFFYDELSGAFKAAGLFDWFCEASTASDDSD